MVYTRELLIELLRGEQCFHRTSHGVFNGGKKEFSKVIFLQIDIYNQ
jgi:hypothetical protein